MTSIYSIGHSNHDTETFLTLLRANGIEVLVDVRSQPYTKYAAHFSQGPLKDAVVGAGIKYLFLGKELGGRPIDDAFYDAEGRVYYDRVAVSPSFLEGIVRLENGISRFRVAMLCAEEDPTACHRRLLVGRVLEERGVTVVHIRGDGRVQLEQTLRNEEESLTNKSQLSLFAAAELPKPAWKSVHPVRPALLAYAADSQARP